jgi:hypothetical protein
VARGQIDTNGTWGFLMTSPHVVPALMILASVLALIGLAKWERIRLFYWRVFSLIVPAQSNKRRAQPSKLNIISAKYGSMERGWHDRKTAVESQIDGDFLSILVGKELLGDPPAIEGYQKELVVEYSFDGGGVVLAKRPQSARLNLPEDAWLLDQIKTLQSNSEEVQQLRITERDAITGRDAAKKHLEESYKTMREYEERISNLANQAISRLHIPDVAGSVHQLRLDSHGEVVTGNNRTIQCVLRMSFALMSLGPEDAKIAKIALIAVGKRACRNISAELPDNPVVLSPNIKQGGVFEARIEFDDDGSNSIPRPLFLIATDVHWGIRSKANAIPG